MARYWDARAGCCPFSFACGGPQAILFSTTLRMSFCSDDPAVPSSWPGSFSSWSETEDEPADLPPSLQQATSSAERDKKGTRKKP